MPKYLCRISSFIPKLWRCMYVGLNCPCNNNFFTTQKDARSLTVRFQFKKTNANYMVIVLYEFEILKS